VRDDDEATVRDAAQRLGARRFARIASGHGSRAPKYRQLLDQALGLDDAELCLLCVLMLRGPQTPGELKQRSERLHSFASLADVEQTLERLGSRELVGRLPRRAGQKEVRYAQLLGEDAAGATASPAEAGEPARDLPARMAALEERVARLEQRLG
jgi:uncharacterized protein YceH (UPF0502 family)